jgi:hypothetical protein
MKESLDVTTKQCTCCQRVLPLSAFNFANTRRRILRGQCKECYNSFQRERAQDLRRADCGELKTGDVKVDLRTGQKLQWYGGRWGTYWDGNMLSALRMYYADTEDDELAGICGVSVKVMLAKAKELGLRKDPDFLRQQEADRQLVKQATEALRQRKREEAERKREEKRRKRDRKELEAAVPEAAWEAEQRRPKRRGRPPQPKPTLKEAARMAAEKALAGVRSRAEKRSRRTQESNNKSDNTTVKTTKRW